MFTTAASKSRGVLQQGAPRDARIVAAVAAVAERMQRGRYELLRLRAPGKLLSVETQSELLDMIIRESSASFGGNMRSYWESRSNYFQELDEWWLAHLDGEVAGWHGFCMWNSPSDLLLYYDSLNVMPSHRRSGVGSLLVIEPYIRRALQGRTLPAIVVRTESPIVYKMLQRFVAITYPDIQHRHSGEYLERALASVQYAQAHLQPASRFDTATFVVNGALQFAAKPYGAAVPRSGAALLDTYFEQHLDINNGDAIYAVGFLTLARFVRSTLAFAFILLKLKISARAPR